MRTSITTSEDLAAFACQVVACCLSEFGGAADDGGCEAVEEVGDLLPKAVETLLKLGWGHSFNRELNFFYCVIC